MAFAQQGALVAVLPVDEQPSWGGWVLTLLVRSDTDCWHSEGRKRTARELCARVFGKE